MLLLKHNECKGLDDIQSNPEENMDAPNSPWRRKSEPTVSFQENLGKYFNHPFFLELVLYISDSTYWLIIFYKVLFKNFIRYLFQKFYNLHRNSM